MSLPETLLWVRIRKSGLHFRRQHPVPPYTLDFYCEAARLAIEIDGAAHELSEGRDATRDAFLLQQQIQTRRISATDVLRNPTATAEFVIALARELIEAET